jgi:polysaccharide biosynthesis protein PslG
MNRRRRKVRRHTKSNHKYLLFISLFGLLIVAGLGIKQIFFPPILPLIHGPHLSKSLYASGLNQQNVLGSRVKNSNLRLRGVSTPTPIRRQRLIPPPTITMSITNHPTPTPVAIISQNQYGIAAGGDLPYMSQADLETYFNQLKELGVTWVRYDFEWGLIQANGSSNFDWSGTDRVVKTANKYGIGTLGTIAYSPAWARLTACSSDFACAPADPNAFGIFAGQVAARYAPLGIHSWEIWNEPNITGFWKPAPNVDSYVAILESAYANIKKADPSAVVLTGGLAAASDENDNISSVTFIRILYELDIKKDFDAIAFHPYTYPAVASYPASWNNWQQINVIRQLMIDNGDGDKALWLTEYGAATGGPGNAHDTIQLENFVFGNDYMTENAQSDIVYDALLTYSKLSGSVGPFFWYSLKDNGTDKNTPENFFGLLRFDGSKKPAYDVYRNAILLNQ